MSYTLRGRLESRLAAMLLPLAAAGVLAVVLDDWWPIELAALMLAVGLALDATIFHRLLPYQPGWVAFPLGVLELAVVLGLAHGLELTAPLRPALALFWISWLWAQVVAHAALPFLRLSYAEDGGELARIGTLAAAGVGAVLLGALGVAWVTLPPTVLLEAGVHQGPLVIDRAQRLVGEPGAIVRGGIKIVADDVEVRDVTVIGARYGIEVDEAENVVLHGVRVTGAGLDGIHVRRSTVTIEDCRIESSGGFSQGIDISFAADLEMSLVDGCTITGGQEGIVTHSAHVVIRDNVVRRTTLRAITMTEMSMGAIEQNTVTDALGVGIFCGDYSMCEVDANRVTGTRPDTASADQTRMGVGVEAHYGAEVVLGRNDLGDNPSAAAAFADASIDGR
jgi:nitrous oxidase accessory protein NosD